MKQFSYCFILIGIFCVFPCLCRADEMGIDKETSFQLALVPPIQIYNEDYCIKGFDLGLVNDVQRDSSGFQLGLILNNDHHSFDGVQLALIYNSADEDMHGLQVGIVNHAGSLRGIQIGLININDDERYKGFMPFINASF